MSVRGGADCCVSSGGVLGPCRCGARHWRRRGNDLDAAEYGVIDKGGQGGLASTERHGRGDEGARAEEDIGVGQRSRSRATPAQEHPRRTHGACLDRVSSEQGAEFTKTGG
jgi:hypothetical protein